MPQVPLTHCPDCGYSLQGLPARYRCPECGFEYDELTSIWKPSKPKFIVYLIIVQGALIALADLTDLANPRGRRGPLGIAGVALDILIVAIIGFAIYALRTRHRWFLAVTPHGILARTLKGRLCIPWARLREAVDKSGSTAASMEQCIQKETGLLLGNPRRQIKLWDTPDADAFVRQALRAMSADGQTNRSPSESSEFITGPRGMQTGGGRD